MATQNAMLFGYIHYGDKYENENRELAARLIKAVSSATNLENRGVLLDSTQAEMIIAAKLPASLGSTVLMKILIQRLTGCFWK